MTAIPNRAVFRSQEVCEIAEVQLYVLRTWEAEFPDLGLSKGAGAPRVYRRGDVERVLRLKHLLFVEGLTLAGARRQLSEEDPAIASSAAEDDDTVPDATVAALLDREVRRTLGDVRSGLQGILGVLGGEGARAIRLVPPRPGGSAKRSSAKAERRKSAGARRRSSQARPRRSPKPAKSGRKAARRKR